MGWPTVTREEHPAVGQLFGEKNTTAALAIFRLNVSLYPQSANTYDSLAEALEAAEKFSEALANYKKVIALEPQNKHAASRIQALSTK